MVEKERQRGLITFLSDYGMRDEFVGVCHAVIARRAPCARVIDLTHAIPRHDVRAGAGVLAAAAPYLPQGVHLAVVDPGVGARGALARRALVLRTGSGQLLVGPDNGLLMPAAELLGAPSEALDIGNSRERLRPLSHTFHGRDIFAPVAAALAAGAPLGSLGEPLEIASLRRLELPVARLAGATLHAHVLRSDGFGNVILDARAEQVEELGVSLGEPLAVGYPGGELGARFARAFADVPAGELLLYEDSQRLLALAVNLGSAAALLGVSNDDQIELRRA
jgi:S-adenosyl-L-methionine hydrolase (adenosine-forming)